jgi:uncharacterized membrane protein YeaQ/YmgE (transglycosylase-associated protein family)
MWTFFAWIVLGDAWIIVGASAGVLAGLMLRRSGFGVLGDTIVGVVGGFVGGLVISVVLPGQFGFTRFAVGSLITAFLGAVILLFIVFLLTRNRAPA